LTLNGDGTFTYTAGTAAAFTYCGNGATSGDACASVTLGLATKEAASGIMVVNDAYSSNVATSLSIKSPGVLLNDSDGAGFPLTVAPGSYAFGTGPSGATLTVTLDKSGAFNATATLAGTYTFTYKAQNSQGTVSTGSATVTLTFPAPSNLAVTVKDPG